MIVSDAEMAASDWSSSTRDTLSKYAVQQSSGLKSSCVLCRPHHGQLHTPSRFSVAWSLRVSSISG